MHVWCHDITHDITVPPDDVTSENKGCASDAACQKRVTTELPKTAAKAKAGTSQIAGWSA